MRYDRVPGRDEVADALGGLGGRATAQALCERLVGRGFPRRSSQLGIQRATDAGGPVGIGEDWTLWLLSERTPSPYDGSRRTA